MTHTMDEIAAEDDRNYLAELESVRKAMDELSRIAEGEVNEPTEFFCVARAHLSDEAVGNLLLQLIGPEVDQDRFSRQGKEMAMTVAEILGPDHAQSLYRFAVLVTRLA
jgi:hypothetical protein